MTSSESLNFFSPEYSSPVMLPPPPPPTTKLPLPPPPSARTTPSPKLHAPPKPEIPQRKMTKPITLQKTYPKLRSAGGRKTNPVVWCISFLCLIFSILLILSGAATLVIFLGIRPRNPGFDTPGGTLNFVYLNSFQSLNAELAFLANFSNPNRRLEVSFESLELGLYFSDTQIASQVISPFRLTKGGVRAVPVHLISSLVYLPPSHALGLQKQVLNNRVVFNMRGVFKVRVELGMIHYSYWLHGRCQVEMTGPPNGFLLSHNCKTKSIFF
ncbi:unnamed protein product [Cuscuta campestris]|uniref:Uncharacterized protein n=1 Tax=Cuscuta campestris TaxID=132261 RepID=A0A484MDE6_9ASTE|nr:unnamed protein product [Cuscuta campestris]